MGASPNDLDRTVSARCEHTVAVTVTYGRRSAIVAEAVRAAAGSGAPTVVVVLNGAHADTRPELVAATANMGAVVRLVDVAENTGSAGGFAAGIRAALDDDEAEYLWLLDDDNRPVADALRNAIRDVIAAERTYGDGMVAASCARPADRYHASLLRGEAATDLYDQPGSFLHLDVVRRLRRGNRPRPESPDRRIPSGPYGGLLVPAALAREIGVPREDFVLYEDDTEYTGRISRAGAALLFVPDAVVLDADKQEPDRPVIGGERPLVSMLHTAEPDLHRLYYQYRNRALLDREAADGRNARFVLNVMVYLVVTAALTVADRRRRPAARVFFRAVTDGLRGRMGRRMAL